MAFDNYFNNFPGTKLISMPDKITDFPKCHAWNNKYILVSIDSHFRKQEVNY